MTRAKVHLGLHDATLEGYTRQRREAVISILKWDSTPLQLRCRDVVLLKELIGNDGLQELIECEQSELLQEVALRLEALHERGELAASLRHFRLLDDANGPVLDVICHEIIIE